MVEFSAIRYEEVTKTTDSIELTKEEVEEIWKQAEDFVEEITHNYVATPEGKFLMHSYSYSENLLIKACFKAKLLYELRRRTKNFDEQMEVNFKVEKESEFMEEVKRDMRESFKNFGYGV